MPLDGTLSITYPTALELIGGLSSPSKMPWYGWSISARLCNNGSKLRQHKDTVCSKCYAYKGFYNIGVVKAAMDRRVKALKDPMFVQAFIIVLNHVYDKNKEGEDRFRWHDSGDLQDEEHLTKIVQIALGCPRIRFYLPSKEYALVKAWAAKHGTFPKNLFVKLSHPNIGGKFPAKSLPKSVAFSSAGRDSDKRLFQCPALKFQGNKCLDCDKCWTRSNINYPVH